MATDQEIISAAQKMFGSETRPEHFTNFSHCCECAEHNDLLSSRSPETLKLEDVNNAGWDPICFATSDAFRYYLPALIRLALESAATQYWYFPQLLFHLIGDGPQNRRVVCCTPKERKVVVNFLWHVLDSQSQLAVEYGIEEELQRALEIWSEDVA